MTSERKLQSLIRLEASRKGIHLWRNNVGAAYMRNGEFIRYGLANDSTIMNETVKSGDLIGIKPVLVTQEMVGKIIGQFISLEVKNSEWTYKATRAEIAQKRWIDLIISNGGDAAFINREGTL